MASDSPFDINSFMNTAVEGVGSTTITPIPAGRVLALIGSDDKAVVAVPFTDQKTHEQRVRIDVRFDIVDDSGAIRAAIDGRDPTITQGYFVDLTPDGKSLDMAKGKNVQLNRLRDALGQNTGAAWVPGMLRGAGPVALDIVVEPDKQDPTVPRNRIKKIGAPNS